MPTAAEIRANPSLRLSPHIAAVELVAQTEPGADRDAKWSERSSLVSDGLAPSLLALAALLEQVRVLGGDRPIRITSGLRPVLATGAGARSQHVAGQAADIQIDGISPRALARVLRSHPWPTGGGPRQVIAETRAGSADLDQPMSQGGGRWVHVAVHGPGFGPTSSRWLESPDGHSYTALR